MPTDMIFALLSPLTFSVMNALVKATALSIPSSEIAFFRSIIGTIVIYSLMRYRNICFSRQGISALTLRGILGALYMLVYFYAISRLPLMDVSVLVNLAPVFVLILSAVVLKEQLPPRAVYILPLFFTGAVLTVKPFQFSSYSVDALYGVFCALLGAGVSITIRHLSKSHHTFEIIFYFMAATTLLSVPLMWQDFVVPNLAEWLYLISIGLVSLAAQVFMTKAFTHGNVVMVNVVGYSGIVYNALWGFLFWREVPDMLTVTGGMLIIGGCIALSWKKTVKGSIKLPNTST
ncbi:DMT family transporter [Sporomusa sp. KB1]|jgi:drug/metabolite transporter (DMT)-like permease|uniref:DMT family transporter n=1 Tax=Sporomusa sp. KB1 TaxID=943346 RepID=UPI0011A21A18|nr:DMT family transporter [Sporomusa sp. KB1]TWH51665.1 drug/metabolite transporter (DMT)-like permease [Sporomusa sp. KB1]TWH52244.1 drug/metabolite transporter (DMT)-like permease [Sporomusa sp. KB1]